MQHLSTATQRHTPDGAAKVLQRFAAQAQSNVKVPS
jgi:hypothetical protein